MKLSRTTARCISHSVYPLASKGFFASGEDWPCNGWRFRLVCRKPWSYSTASRYQPSNFLLVLRNPPKRWSVTMGNYRMRTRKCDCDFTDEEYPAIGRKKGTTLQSNQELKLLENVARSTKMKQETLEAIETSQNPAGNQDQTRLESE